MPPKKQVEKQSAHTSHRNAQEKKHAHSRRVTGRRNAPLEKAKWHATGLFNALPTTLVRYLVKFLGPGALRLALCKRLHCVWELVLCERDWQRHLVQSCAWSDTLTFMKSVSDLQQLVCIPLESLFFPLRGFWNKHIKPRLCPLGPGAAQRMLRHREWYSNHALSVNEIKSADSAAASALQRKPQTKKFVPHATVVCLSGCSVQPTMRLTVHWLHPRMRRVEASVTLAVVAKHAPPPTMWFVNAHDMYGVQVSPGAMQWRLVPNLFLVEDTSAHFLDPSRAGVGGGAIPLACQKLSNILVGRFLTRAPGRCAAP
jgi:hypothetical protein